jgi:hypothetical protein
MLRTLVFFVFTLCLFQAGVASAQDLKTSVADNKELDSLRKKLDESPDSVVFTSRYVRFTTLQLTKDSIQTLPLDTSLRGIQNYSVLAQPRRPTINNGNLGLPAKDMLFEPTKTIGFDAGFHALDFYRMTPEDIIFYQARTPFSSLYYVSGGEQILQVTHSQNIKPNWNFGANYNRIGADGAYPRQRGDHLNGTFFTWYQSPGKRYNLMATGVFNTLKAQENGGVQNDSLFTTGSNFGRASENVNLTNARQFTKRNSIMIKQTYFVGRIDTLAQEVSQKVLPTNKLAYTFKYDKDSYNFIKDQLDDHTVLPRGIIDSVYTNDSTSVRHVQNEFVYSFFLRGKSSSVIKNELKVDLGIRHDFYQYGQYSRYQDLTNYYAYTNSFQNTTLLGGLGYRFSNRIDLTVDAQQIFQGRQMGDFLYEAKSNLLLSNAIGRIVLGAYMQNKSPEEVYNRYFSNHYSWVNDFDRTKTVNLSFKYINDRVKFDVGAEYFLVNDYLYFAQSDDRSGSGIVPMQLPGSINLLKISAGKRLRAGRFNLESYVVYQKTDKPDYLRTPEVYTFNSFYFDQTFFKVLRTNIGFDVRYNTPYQSYSYSPAAGQFYLGGANELKSEPVVDVWLRASLRKANIFVKYEYANQGLLSKGFYTVNRYPMPDAMLKFGVRWNFYD